MMKNENNQIRQLTQAEMSSLKGAGPNPRYIGPPVENGVDPKGTDQNFFTKLVAMFSFDFSALFGAND